MTLSVESLKQQFKQYLIDHGKNPETDKDGELSGASIFTYSDLFEDFVEEKFKIKMDDVSFDIEDLLEMDMEEGQFVMPQDDDETKVSEDELILTILNTLLGDEEFAKNLDETNDGKLDSDEIKKFLTYSNEQDDDTDKFTFADIAFGVVDAKNGDYKPSDIDLNAQKETQETKETQSTGGSSGGGGGGYSTGSSSGNPTSPKTQDNKKDFSKMSIDELEKERVEQANTVSNAQQEAKSTYEQLSSYVQQGYEALQEATKECDEQEKEAINTILEYEKQIADKNTQILDTKAIIADYDAQICTAESELRVSQAQLTSYQGALASIPAAPLGEEDPYAGKRAQLSSAISQLQSAIPQKEAEITELQSKRDESKEQLANQENELSTLQSAESEEKQNADKAREELGEELLAVMESYDQYKAEIDTNMKTAEANIQNAQTTLNEIETTLIEKNQKQADRLANTNLQDEFDPTGNGYTWVEMQRKQGVLPYDVIAPANADPDEELPVLVYMHGQGSGHKDIYNQVFANYNLETWNGYIICVDNNDTSSWVDNEKDLDKILDDFSSQYNIDTDRISLAGYSLGGSGVISFSTRGRLTDSDGYNYRNAAIITGYNQIQGEFDVPIIAFNDRNNHNAMKSVKNNLDLSEGGEDRYIETGASHGDVDYAGFTWDANNNGKADIFEFFEGSLE